MNTQCHLEEDGDQENFESTGYPDRPNSIIANPSSSENCGHVAVANSAPLAKAGVN